MSDFMRVFEAKALAQALTDAGHSTSERTAQRWKKGETRPKPQDVRAIRELVGALLPNTAKEAEPPAWATRLQQTVDSIHARQELIAQAASRNVIEALASPELLEWAQRIGERTAEPPSQSDEGSGDRSGGSAPGTRVLRDPEPS